jgi:hypothetical protein
MEYEKHFEFKQKSQRCLGIFQKNLQLMKKGFAIGVEQRLWGNSVPKPTPVPLLRFPPIATRNSGSVRPFRGDRPAAISASASRSFLMISSGVCRFCFMRVPAALRAAHSHNF